MYHVSADLAGFLRYTEMSAVVIRCRGNTIPAGNGCCDIAGYKVIIVLCLIGRNSVVATIIVPTIIPTDATFVVCVKVTSALEPHNNSWVLYTNSNLHSYKSYIQLCSLIFLVAEPSPKALGSQETTQRRDV